MEEQDNKNISIEEEVKVTEQEIPFEDFEFGDLYIKCSCGHEEPFIKGIEGIRVELPATNKHNLKIVCSKCKHELMLFYKKSENIEELRKIKEERNNKDNKEQEEIKEENK